MELKKISVIHPQKVVDVRHALSLVLQLPCSALLLKRGRDFIRLHQR